MRIAICDDVTRDRVTIVAALNDYLTVRGMMAEIVEFATPNRLMTAVRRVPFDLYLLDVLLSDRKTGIDLVRKLRTVQANAPVILLSTSREYAVEAFAVEAVSYLEKPWAQDLFFRSLDRAMEVLQKEKDDCLGFKTNDGCIRIKADQIEYVITSETVNYVTICHTCGVAITQRDSIRNFAEQYGRRLRLVPAGRSILINPAQIAALEGSRVQFISGKMLEIPKSAVLSLSKAVLALSSPF